MNIALSILIFASALLLSGCASDQKSSSPATGGASKPAITSVAVGSAPKDSVDVDAALFSEYFIPSQGIVLGSSALDQLSKTLPRAKEEYPYILKIEDIYGAEGYWFTYFLSKGAITVLLMNDLGLQPVEMYHADLPLTDNVFQAYLRLINSNIEERYVNDAIHDGLWVRFKIILADETVKSVTLKNQFNEVLFNMMDAVSAVVPPELALRQPRAASVKGGPIFIP